MRSKSELGESRCGLLCWRECWITADWQNKIHSFSINLSKHKLVCNFDLVKFNKKAGAADGLSGTVCSQRSRKGSGLTLRESLAPSSSLWLRNLLWILKTSAADGVCALLYIWPSYCVITLILVWKTLLQEKFHTQRSESEMRNYKWHFGTFK